MKTRVKWESNQLGYYEFSATNPLGVEAYLDPDMVLRYEQARKEFLDRTQEITDALEAQEV